VDEPGVGFFFQDEADAGGITLSALEEEEGKKKKRQQAACRASLTCQRIAQSAIAAKP
jgi:hypothetical protein